jgi:AraC-like DNA-binding protein
LLAEELGVSRSALAARFSERLGQSPMRYIARWRNQLASHLLQTTDLPVGVVATRVGYESEPAFSRAFKRSTGSAPVAWRNAARRAACSRL